MAMKGTHAHKAAARHQTHGNGLKKHGAGLNDHGAGLKEHGAGLNGHTKLAARKGSSSKKK
jgi:hypothetical protein